MSILKAKFQALPTLTTTELALELTRLEANEEARNSFYRQCVARELDNRFGFAPLHYTAAGA